MVKTINRVFATNILSIKERVLFGSNNPSVLCRRVGLNLSLSPGSLTKAEDFKISFKKQIQLHLTVEN